MYQNPFLLFYIMALLYSFTYHPCFLFFFFEIFFIVFCYLQQFTYPHIPGYGLLLNQNTI